MNFLKDIVKNFSLILKMGRSDFKNKFSNTSLGAVWGFAQPIIFMLTYIFVFKFILKAGDTGGYPYVAWILPAISIWNFMNDAITNGTQSIRNYSYLVKKVIFPINIIPLISFVSSFIVQSILILLVFIICLIIGVFPNILGAIYIVLASICFIIAFTRLTSAVTTMVPDFGQLLGIVMQLLFWFTPILWDISTLQGILLKIMKCSPFAYIVTGFRNTMLGQEYIFENGWIYTVIFWLVTIIIFIYGNYIFNKNKKEFADVL